MAVTDGGGAGGINVRGVFFPFPVAGVVRGNGERPGSGQNKGNQLFTQGCGEFWHCYAVSWCSLSQRNRGKKWAGFAEYQKSRGCVRS